MSEITDQLLFPHTADHWLVQCLCIAENLALFPGESPISCKSSETGNEEKQNRHPSPPEKHPEQPLSFLRSDELHLPSHSQEPLGSMASRGQRTPSSDQRKGTGMDEWAPCPHPSQILRSGISIDSEGISQPAVPALDVSVLLTLGTQPRRYKPLCAGTALLPATKGRPEIKGRDLRIFDSF